MLPSISVRISSFGRDTIYHRAEPVKVAWTEGKKV
jgi:hypothetical protein